MSSRTIARPWSFIDHLVTEGSRARRLTLLAVAVAATLFTTTAAASAAEPSSWWQLGSGSRPANLAPEAKGEIVLTAENLGDGVAAGSKSPIVVTDNLPARLKPLTIAGDKLEGNGIVPMTCELAALTCSFKGDLVPYDSLEVRIEVEALPGAESGELNEAAISGGGASANQISRPITVSEEPTPFGIEDFRLHLEEEGGALATQAGAHPFQFTTTVAINQGPDHLNQLTGKPNVEPAALAKDVDTKLPAGLIGNPTPFQTCTLAQFLTRTNGGLETACPPQSALGVTSVAVNVVGLLGYSTFTQPFFNLEPFYGEPARFGFFVAVAGVPVVLDASLRSGGPGETEPDYGIDVDATNISQTASLSNARVSVWGTPGDPSHDSSRGWGCLGESEGFESGSHAPCRPAEEAHPPAFLTMPTACNGPIQASVEADSWVERIFETFRPFEPLQSLDGCNKLPFSPTIAAEPTSDAATSPTGLGFDLDFRNEGLTNSAPGALAQSEIKKAVVTLPEGFTTNPSVAEGLKACPEAAYDSATAEPGTGCPEESKIGDVEVESPVVNPKEKIKGSLYVAEQGRNPFHSLLALYMVIQNPELGVLIKSAGKVEPNPVTGQLTTTFDDIAQLPFSHFHLSFRQGQRSPLITPPACGTYTAKAALYPYSEPAVPRIEESSFKITAGPEGLGCPSGGTPPFHPGLEAGTINNAAGTYSPFYTHITRKDSEQEITHFSIKLPPGLSGKLVGVSQCSDAAIAAAKAREHEGGGQEELNSPSCPASSEVGHTLVGTGVGNVLAYAPGKLYLAGPYKGSNLSIVSITAAKVGPFDLGTVVIREGLKVDPTTAQVSVDAAGSDPIPHIVDGIPVHLRDIRIYVDRPSFTINPTSCAKMSTAATVLGSGTNFASEADDQPVTVTSPFQAADCASLGFKPELGLKLLGKTRRGGLPKLVATVTYPKGGAYANIASTIVTLPDSELLEQGHIGTSCTRVQFAANECPRGSIYGSARAITPLLDYPLEGPVYLRSSSNPLPDLVVTLRGPEAQPIEVVLDGRVDSVNGGIRTRFNSVPDAPCGTPYSPSFCKKLAKSLKFKFEKSSASESSDAVASPSRTASKDLVSYDRSAASASGASLKGSTKRGGHPALRAVLKMKPGEANIAKISVALPHSEFLAQSHIKTVCTRVQFAAGAGNGAECPKGSIYGFARAKTPLLDNPLEGPVYLRSSSNPLPDLVVALHGQIDIDLDGRIDSKNGGIRTTFDTVPDAPVSEFVLSMEGGKKGLIENSTDICQGTHKAQVKATAQNGKLSETAPALQPECGKKAKKKGSKKGKGGKKS